tara:strand:- start:229 stop:2169 length:1941 start_codon:yes stop_codon:yes gene_type:complete
MNKTTLTTLLLTIFFSLNLVAQNTYFVKVGGNNNGGLTEENAFTTVNNAVVAASDGDTITIVGSINQTGQVGIGKSISFVGQSDATITGASARMYVINAAGKTISFTNITFQDATTTNPGAVFTITQNSDLTLTGCILKNNTSTVNGGTILAGGTGVITITNSLFDGNSANRGGAVAVTSVGRQLIVTGSTFVNNTATGIDGGALYLAGNNNLSSITNTTIFNNQVNNTQDQSKGGGIKIEGTRPFTIQNSLIYGNFVTNGTTDVPSDLGVIANVELNLINSLTKKITPNLAANDSFATSIVAADLTASNLSFDSTTGNVIYDAVAVGTESPIDFGSDGEDAGSWNSGLTLLPPDTTPPVITLTGEPSVTVEVGTSYTDAGDTNTTGTNNTLIGYNADLSSNNLTNATAIGANATVNTSNKIKLGNSNVTNVETAGSITAGAITIPNTDGTSGQVLVTDGSGTLSWSTPSSGSTTYSVGDMVQGGKVFWVDSTGQHGLVVALEDAGGSSAMDWNAGTTSSGLNLETLAQSSGMYAGKMNTAIIIAAHAAAANNGNNFAARACNEYTYTQNGVEYSDWYLPSKDELHLIKTSGVGAPNLYSYNYWSSTEHDANNAYSEVLGNYANNYNSFKPKDTGEDIKVRAVRSF